MSDILSPGQLLDVTGTPQRARQKAILERWGIFAKERDDGSLMVTWSAINDALSDPERLPEKPDLSNPLVSLVLNR